MKPADIKRLEALEQRMGGARSSGHWDKEFDAMTQDERDAVREYLLHIKSSQDTSSAIYASLRFEAVSAVEAVRARL
jgi:hypothetical protein